MNNCNNIYLVRFDMINNSIGPLNDFTHLWNLIFRHRAARKRESAICSERLVKRSAVRLAYSGED